MAIKNKIEVLYVISDLHLPYHNEKLWKILKDILRTTPKNKTIVINGDFLEMHIMSSYAKSKHCIADFEMELEAAISYF
jgi:UDP-2,3-diacylglucosamine pyrophosphatase LpxH